MKQYLLCDSDLTLYNKLRSLYLNITSEYILYNNIVFEKKYYDNMSIKNEHNTFYNSNIFINDFIIKNRINDFEYEKIKYFINNIHYKETFIVYRNDNLYEIDYYKFDNNYYLKILNAKNDVNDDLVNNYKLYEFDYNLNLIDILNKDIISNIIKKNKLDEECKYLGNWIA